VRALLSAGFALLVAAVPASAVVKESDPNGFTSSHSFRVTATPADVWAVLADPARWWSGAHSWSGSAKNFVMEPVAGGCFCERWEGNSVEHARVIHAVKGQLLRLSGAFGPLQGEALTGTLSFTLKAEGAVTVLTVDYVVGGHARFPLKTIAGGVDQVIGEQAKGLAGLFPAAG